MTYRQLIVMLATVLLTVACQTTEQRLPVGNAVYYWRTDLRLDSAERAFLTVIISTRCIAATSTW